MFTTEGRYFRMDGSPYENWMDWAQDFEDIRGRIVGQDVLWNGVFVSTVWLGLNHRWGDGPPLIFETMAFHHVLSGDRWADDYQARYSTLRQAALGHEATVRMYGSVAATFRMFWNAVRAAMQEMAGNEGDTYADEITTAD